MQSTKNAYREKNEKKKETTIRIKKEKECEQNLAME